MGENVPAANNTEIRKVVANYMSSDNVLVLSAEQIDPDATLFSLQINGEPYFLLEEDYVPDVESALLRFQEFQVKTPQLLKVMNTVANDGDPLDSYEVPYTPKKLKYPLSYFLAKAGKP